MSSITLPSQSYRPATPWGVAAARAVADTMSLPLALLRSGARTISRQVHQARLDDSAASLRALAQAHLATNPSYAADLLAAAEQHGRSANRA